MRVTAQCIGCKATRSFGPGDVARGDHPMCDVCFMPMIAVGASADLGQARKTATKRRKPLRWRSGTVHDGESVACVLRRDGREHARVIRKRADPRLWTASACGQKVSGIASSLESAREHAAWSVRRFEAEALLSSAGGGPMTAANPFPSPRSVPLWRRALQLACELGPEPDLGELAANVRCRGATRAAHAAHLAYEIATNLRMDAEAMEVAVDAAERWLLMYESIEGHHLLVAQWRQDEKNARRKEVGQ